jgi:hypothetical protein
MKWADVRASRSVVVAYQEGLRADTTQELEPM